MMDTCLRILRNVEEVGGLEEPGACPAATMFQFGFRFQSHMDL